MNTLPPFVCLTERGGYDTDEEDAIREAARYDVVGRSGNIATAVTLDGAQRLAQASGCKVVPHG